MGVTGRLRFWQDGRRRGYVINILNVVDGRFHKVIPSSRKRVAEYLYKDQSFIVHKLKLVLTSQHITTQKHSSPTELSKS